MRVIGGAFRSRRLLAPDSPHCRPTLDRVRESLFNMLAERVEDARVLDLFAGSGANGFEALSRGARSAVFCDLDPRAAQVLRRNAESLAVTDRARILRMDWRRALSLLKSQGQQFTLVFLDPPFLMDAEPVLTALLAQGLLSPEGVSVLERDRRRPPSLPPEAVLLRSRHYGQTAIDFIVQGGAREDRHPARQL